MTQFKTKKKNRIVEEEREVKTKTAAFTTVQGACGAEDAFLEARDMPQARTLDYPFAEDAKLIRRWLRSKIPGTTLDELRKIL